MELSVLSFETPVEDTQIKDLSGMAFFFMHGRTLTPTFPHPKKEVYCSTIGRTLVHHGKDSWIVVFTYHEWYCFYLRFKDTKCTIF